MARSPRCTRSDQQSCQRSSRRSPRRSSSSQRSLKRHRSHRSESGDVGTVARDPRKSMSRATQESCCDGSSGAESPKVQSTCDAKGMTTKKHKKSKEAEKALKKAKKAKKELKKAKKMLKRAQKKKKKKKHSSSSSSSEGSSSGSVDLEFVLSSGYGAAARADAHNPDARISQWLGLSGSMSSFVHRADDADIVKEVREAKIKRDENGKKLENRGTDWMCQQLVGKDGKSCGARNFKNNERCYQCKGLRPRDAVLARDLQGKQPQFNDHGRGTLNGKVCSKWKGR